MAQLIFLLRQEEVTAINKFMKYLSFNNIAVHIEELTWQDLETIGTAISSLNKLPLKIKSDYMAIQAMYILRKRAEERNIEFLL